MFIKDVGDSIDLVIVLSQHGAALDLHRRRNTASTGTPRGRRRGGGESRRRILVHVCLKLLLFVIFLNEVCG